MLNNFDFLANLPLLVFSFFFLVVFILFLWTGIVLLRARGNPENVEKGRQILLIALWGLFITLLIILIFYLVSFLLKKGEVFQPPQASLGEFPVSPAINFPSPPQFIKIGDYYFTGPRLLKKYNTIDKSAIYTVLCKKNGNYDIMFIEESERAWLLEHEQYGCWLEKCGQNLKNLYTAVFWTSGEKYNFEDRRRIKEELENQINPPCPLN